MNATSTPIDREAARIVVTNLRENLGFCHLRDGWCDVHHAPASEGEGWTGGCLFYVAAEISAVNSVLEYDRLLRTTLAASLRSAVHPHDPLTRELARLIANWLEGKD